MEDNIAPHEELAELLADDDTKVEPEVDLNGEVKEDLNAVPEEKGEEPEPESVDKTDDESDPVEPPSTDENAEEDARFKAMLAKTQDEVAKRQSLEAEVQQMKQNMAQMQAEQQPKIDPYEQPEEYAAQQQQIANAQLFNSKVEMSEMIIKTQVGEAEYEETVEVFKQAAMSNPALVQALQSSAIPAKFAYDEGLKIKALNEMGNDPIAYKEAIAEQVRKEVLAELADKPVPKETLPSSIANAGTKAPVANELPADDLASLLGEV